MRLIDKKNDFLSCLEYDSLLWRVKGHFVYVVRNALPVDYTSDRHERLQRRRA
jgi:hypothetical protein